MNLGIEIVSRMMYYMCNRTEDPFWSKAPTTTALDAAGVHLAKESRTGCL